MAPAGARDRKKAHTPNVVFIPGNDWAVSLKHNYSENLLFLH